MTNQSYEKLENPVSVTVTQLNNRTHLSGTTANMNATTKWPTNMPFWNTDDNKWYYNAGTEGSPTPTELAGIDEFYDVVDRMLIDITKGFVYFANSSSLNPFTKTNGGAGATASFPAEINSGLRLTTAGANGDGATETLNNESQFDPANCTIYGIIKRNTTNTFVYAGISDNLNRTTDESVIIVNHTANAQLHLSASNGGTGNSVATDVALSTNLVKFKIECGASNQKLYLLVAGVWTLKATQSTQLPTDPNQPYYEVGALEAAVKTGDLIMLMVFNNA